MKQLFLISLLAFGLNAQAKDIHLICDVEGTWNISFNTVTSRGAIDLVGTEGTTTADLTVSNSEYMLKGLDGKSVIIVKVDRQTLGSSIDTKFIGSLEFLTPILRKGKCSIAPKTNNVI